MSSEKQIATNRANALKSTGPKTASGKGASSRNALKHGLLSAQMVLPDEDPKELAALAEAIHARLAPEGEMEQALADRVVACLWRLRRVHQVEGSMYRYGIGSLQRGRARLAAQRRLLPALYDDSDDDLDDAEGDDSDLALVYIKASDGLAKLTRYETTIERGLYQALHELQRLQADRGARATAPAVVDVDVRVGE